MSKKGQKSLRGQPELYEGEIKVKKSIALTATGAKGLDEVAQSFDLSRSELCEQVGRGILTVTRSQKGV
jgi:hypothetical protein